MEQDRFSKLLELLHTMVTWLLKSVLALVVGVNTIKSMLAPVTDSITATALQRGLTVIPGGQAVNAVSGVVIGSGVLIKNAIGVGGMLVLVLAVSVPVIKMTVFILLYKLIAAMLQPIADARMIRGINSVSQGGQLLISTVLSVIVLFLVSIAIIAVSTNVTYYS
jgi:stage III sporulation protein AE